MLLDAGDAAPQLVARLRFGDTSGRNEAWLRDTLLAQPTLLPIADIDPSFGPLIPLGRELQCAAGRIDAAFIDRSGRLTLVECKLWRNPAARREVVAQTIDYASTLSTWTYSDLQRQVRAARGEDGNLPYELVRAVHPDLEESVFVDAVTRGLRAGRFLLVVAGDGIREDVARITSLVQRHATLGFSFALVEVALYGLADGRLLVQPRTLARTEILERPIVVLGVQDSPAERSELRIGEPADTASNLEASTGESPEQAKYRAWWQPVIDHPLDDPEQEKPQLYWKNHIRTNLPWPGTWLTCYRFGEQLGVSTSGRQGPERELMQRLEPQSAEILAELPEGTRHDPAAARPGYTVRRWTSEFANEEAQRRWLGETLNEFVNVLRPRVAGLLRD